MRPLRESAHLKGLRREEGAPGRRQQMPMVGVSLARPELQGGP